MRAQAHGSGEWAADRLWRHGLALLILCGPLVVLMSIRPFTDASGYLNFADRRAFLGIPNFMDVASNLAFLLTGIAGLRGVLRVRPQGSLTVWLVFFAAVTLVSAGSSYFHWNPSAETIVWDRLPMVVAFAALLVAILSDYVNPRLGDMRLLATAIVIGLASVLYGYGYQDLRFYGWIQALPMLAILAAFLYPPRYTCRGYLLVALGGYALAKLAELYDRPLFAFASGIVSGHTLKHLVGAFAVWLLVVMIARRAPIVGEKNS